MHEGASASPTGPLVPCGTEPVSRLGHSGFDPSRGAANILPLLTPEQEAFILRMEPSVLDQEISQYDWDYIDCKVDNPDVDGWPYWHWFGGMRLHWPAGRASDNPEITFRFNPDGLSVRDRLIASADTRPEGGDSTEIEAPFTSGAVPEGQTPNLQDHQNMKGEARE
jgi:hypothetical protein